MNRKKAFLALLIALLGLPMGVLAEGKSATANGAVKAVTTYDVTAPFSGTLLPFDWESGDEVLSGETLFVFDTLRMEAPADGQVTLFASVGDRAEDVLEQYGMLAAIEKSASCVIEATTQGAYRGKENKFIHNGETLYFRLTKDSAEVGSGRVIAVTPKGYTVEVMENAFELGEKVRLYREEEKKAFSCVGEGTIARADEVRVSGTGRIVACAVEDGQRVKRGDLLFETVSSDCPAGQSSVEIIALNPGMLDALKVTSGQQVYKGQALVTIHDESALKIVAEVDEVDLARIRVGANVSFVFDSYPNERVTGMISRVSKMGVQKQNATYYDVDISFDTALDIRLLMSATVTLP